MTHRIDPFLYDSQKWTFWNMTRGNEPFFFKYDSQNWTFVKKKVPFKKWVRFFESYAKKKVQFFESEKKFNSCWEEVHKRGSIQWVIYKEFNPLSHCWKKKRVQFFESFFQGSILWVIFPDRINHFCESKFLQNKFYESCWKNGFNSVSHVKQKGSILWVMSKKKKRFNSVSYIQKKSILGVIFTFFVQNILWVIFLQKRFNSVSQNFWKVQNSFNHIEKKKFNSVGHIQEKGSIHWDLLKKKVQFFESSWKRKETILYFRIKRSSTLWVFSFDTRFNSLSHSSRKVQFFESFLTKFVLNSLSHILEIRFNFSNWKEGFSSVSEKKGSILWVFFASKKNRFFESYSKRDSILWIILTKTFNSMSHKKGINSMSHNSKKKRFNSLSHAKKKVQFFESNWKRLQLC